MLPSVPASADAATAPVRAAQGSLPDSLPERAMRGALRAAPKVIAALAVLVPAAFFGLASWADATSGLKVLLGGGLVLLALRLAHALRARAMLPPPPAARWVPQYLAGAGAMSLWWAALPWLAFAAAEPAARAGVAVLILAAALAESLALRAMSRVAIVQAAVTLAPAGVWLLAMGGAAGWAASGGLFVGLAMLSALCLSRDRQLHALMTSEQEAHRLSAEEAVQAERIARLEMELARAGADLESALARAAAHEASERAGRAQSAERRTIDLEKRSLELAREAVTDPLTLLPNRKGI
ncbi:MAG: hypothetical protein AB7U92_23305, partial [Piscinibacter sp.]|uniref:hypothetical protein n=1 Tax=Piscinibacter sp. TaxID=1903157 RepID=UPI003D1190EC